MAVSISKTGQLTNPVAVDVSSISSGSERAKHPPINRGTKPKAVKAFGQASYRDEVNALGENTSLAKGGIATMRSDTSSAIQSEPWIYY